MPDESPQDGDTMPSLIDNVTNDDDEPAKTNSGVSESDKMDDAGNDDNKLKRGCKCVLDFYKKNEFLILIITGILLAKAYPPIGAIYLAPDITAKWIAVMFIFLLAGLGLKTEEFSKAFQQIKFNSFVFFFNFGVDSAFVFGLSRLLAKYNIVNQFLADGMVIASCLPLTINMCVVLTKASGGDEAAAICNSAMWNLVGVFLSPTLILGYIGVSGNVNVFQVFVKLAVRVLVPIAVGQLLKYYVPLVANFVKTYKPYFKQAQVYALVFIVYTVFCKTFIDEENDVPIRDIFMMIVFVAISLAVLMVLSWYSMGLLFKDEIKLRVMGLYACTHKTVAMGIPLITAIYDGNPAIGLYTLPLLIWHPMQLVVGTFLSPRLLAWVESFDLDEETGKVAVIDTKDADKAVADEAMSTAESVEVDV